MVTFEFVDSELFQGISWSNKKKEPHNSNISVILEFWTACAWLSRELALQKNWDHFWLFNFPASQFSQIFSGDLKKKKIFN